MKNDILSKLTFLLSLTLTCIFLPETLAQKLGDRVVVTANFDTKIHKAVVDKVFEGEIHTIVSIKGKWCALDNVEGWLPMQYVMNLNNAKKYYDKRIGTQSQDAEALAHRGMIHYENQELTKAFTDLNASLRINQKNPVTWSNRGMVLHAQQKYGLAIKDLSYAIKLNPEFPHAHFNLGRVNYAINEYDKAIASYDRAIKLDPKVPRYFVNRGSAKLYARDFDGARKDYMKALELNQRNSDAYVGLSNLALADNDLQTALEKADRAVKLQSQNAMALNARGWVLYKLGKIEEAIFDLTRANRYAPNLSLPYNNRGVCYVAQQEYDKAISDYNKLIQLAPKSAIGHANRGVAYMGKGEYSKAKADLEQAVDIAPEMSDGLNSLAWFLATCPKDTYRDGKVAVEMATKACKLSEWNDWSYLETLAVAQAELSEFAEAIETVGKAKKLAPDNKQPELDELIAVFQQAKPFEVKRARTRKVSFATGDPKRGQRTGSARFLFRGRARLVIRQNRLRFASPDPANQNCDFARKTRVDYRKPLVG